MALFGKSDTEIKTNLFLLIDAFAREEDVLIKQYSKKIPYRDKTMDIMVEVCSMYAAHIHAKHGEIEGFDSVDAALNRCVDVISEEKTGVQAETTRLVGRAIFVDNTESAIQTAMRQSAAKGMKAADLFAALSVLVHRINVMLMITNTPLLATAVYG